MKTRSFAISTIILSVALLSKCTSQKKTEYDIPSHVPPENRESSWHPVIHEEMTKKDDDIKDEDLRPAFASAMR